MEICALSLQVYKKNKFRIHILPPVAENHAPSAKVNKKGFRTHILPPVAENHAPSAEPFEKRKSVEYAFFRQWRKNCAPGVSL